MNIRFAVAILVALAFSRPAQAQDERFLRLDHVIPMPVKGRIDHMAIDLDGQRLFVAALGNNSVEVIDLKARKVEPSLDGVEEAQGITFIPSSRQLCATSGGAGKVYVYDGTFHPIAELPGLDDADNARYDADSQRLYVGYGSGTIAVIDAQHPSVVAQIKLEAHPESFQLEKAGPRMFVNVPGGGHVAVIDRKAGKVIARWAVKDASANFPMALDEAGHRLLIGCRKPAKLLVLDTETGTTIASTDTCGDADDVWYDAPTNRAYITGGEGFVAVHDLSNAAQCPVVAKVPTRKGARTSFFDAPGQTLYVAAPRADEHEAQIQVFKVVAEKK